MHASPIRGILGLPYGVKPDAWFGSIRTAMSVAAKGHEGMFQVK